LNFKSEQIKKADVKLYPVSANTEEETNKFFKQYAPNIQNLTNTKILLDDDYKFADAFFVGPFPTSFLYDKDNKLVKVFEGGDDVVLFLNELN